MNKAVNMKRQYEKRNNSYSTNNYNNINYNTSRSGIKLYNTEKME